MLQLWKPLCLEPVLPRACAPRQGKPLQWEATAIRSLCTATREQAQLTAATESLAHSNGEPVEPQANR